MRGWSQVQLGGPARTFYCNNAQLPLCMHVQWGLLGGDLFSSLDNMLRMFI